MSSRIPQPAVDQAAIYRMQLGAYVKGRLLATAGVFKMPAQGLDLFVKRDFLTPDDRAWLLWRTAEQALFKPAA